MGNVPCPPPAPSATAEYGIVFLKNLLEIPLTREMENAREVRGGEDKMEKEGWTVRLRWK